MASSQMWRDACSPDPKSSERQPMEARLAALRPDASALWPLATQVRALSVDRGELAGAFTAMTKNPQGQLQNRRLASMLMRDSQAM